MVICQRFPSATPVSGGELSNSKCRRAGADLRRQANRRSDTRGGK